MALFGPEWWHHHGIKMRIHIARPGEKELHIAAPAAELSIVYLGDPDEPSECPWDVKWRIKFSQVEEVEGTICIDAETLAAMFGLASEVKNPSKHLTLRYDADVAVQGKFIRRGEYLNVPCPGTGHDGDPNVSLYIDEAMQQAVRKLLEE